MPKKDKKEKHDKLKKVKEKNKNKKHKWIAFCHWRNGYYRGIGVATKKSATDEFDKVKFKDIK